MGHGIRGAWPGRIGQPPSHYLANLPCAGTEFRPAAERLMANPFLELWKSSVCAWTGAVGGLLLAEMLHGQIELSQALGERALRFWIDAWMSTAPRRKCSVGERMAALSL